MVCDYRTQTQAFPFLAISFSTEYVMVTYSVEKEKQKNLFVGPLNLDDV